MRMVGMHVNKNNDNDYTIKSLFNYFNKLL